GLRAASFLKPSGSMVLNEQVIHPMPVITGKMAYPEDIPGKLRAAGINVYQLNALAIATNEGNSKVANAVLLGAAARICGIEYDVCKDVILSNAPSKYAMVNVHAFDRGYTVIKGMGK
ncbi:MAG TPA: 2-oxoacid:acceptor oxidoreductase family protein, partial [Chitinispirillaceae bacterium]|nr:2-oxoacid:acceptor oxidoreductase family protein [Chitinispirillaceae bacterium]